MEVLALFDLSPFLSDLCLCSETDLGSLNSSCALRKTKEIRGAKYMVQYFYFLNSNSLREGETTHLRQTHKYLNE